jgi:hypothetical protein
MNCSITKKSRKIKGFERNVFIGAQKYEMNRVCFVAFYFLGARAGRSGLRCAAVFFRAKEAAP